MERSKQDLPTHLPRLHDTGAYQFDFSSADCGDLIRRFDGLTSLDAVLLQSADNTTCHHSDRKPSLPFFDATRTTDTDIEALFEVKSA